jgi:hypothetical protein
MQAGMVALSRLGGETLVSVMVMAWHILLELKIDFTSLQGYRGEKKTVKRYVVHKA